MQTDKRYVALRLLPLVLIATAVGFWFNDVQNSGPYVPRNLLPLALLVVLGLMTLLRGQGQWTGSGMQLPLATAGFAIPTLGLSLYLHYAFAVNLNDMFADATQPQRLFAYLPLYSVGAGLIGFIIGWIVGRNV